MLSEDKRKDIVMKAANRIVENFDKMSGYSKVSYISKLVNMLDDNQLVMLDFAIEMTPNQSVEDKK